MSAFESEQDANFDLSDKTGALLMHNKEERQLIKELLLMTRNSERVRPIIVNRLGEKSIQTGENLLKAMGNS